MIEVTQAEWGTCPACKEYDFIPHRCKLAFEVWQSAKDAGYDTDEDSYEDGSWTIRADDLGEAVEKWADQYDSGGDYIIIGGSEATVFACPKGKPEEKKKYVVHGEAVREYHAKEIDEGH